MQESERVRALNEFSQALRRAAPSAIEYMRALQKLSAAMGCEVPKRPPGIRYRSVNGSQLDHIARIRAARHAIESMRAERQEHEKLQLPLKRSVLDAMGCEIEAKAIAACRACWRWLRASW